MRIGHGYDIHRFEANATQNEVTLGGVKIPHQRGLIAHSDGDVVIHAICDALLGACALGDIGQHFPDTSPLFKGIDSRKLLRQVVEKIFSKKYIVNNLDITIIAKEPKINPYSALMKENLAQDLKISSADINIKATTHEDLDALGKGEGIAAHAVVLLIKEATV
ncbi:MAG: 2-C-methyl-D-erythritol 2,4-cyclodiphosphate synthase [Candidatus Berkiellales bacterium]